MPLLQDIVYTSSTLFQRSFSPYLIAERFFLSVEIILGNDFLSKIVVSYASEIISSLRNFETRALASLPLGPTVI